MSEATTPPSRRKRYESRKTVAQIWTGRAIMGGILAAVGFILYQFGFTVYLLFAKPDFDGPLIWATSEGIGYSKNGGERSGVYQLPSNTGDKVQNPRYNIVGGNLVYYSPDNHSLCIANSTDPTRWIALEASMGDCTIRDIRADGTAAVTLIGYPKNSDPDALPQAVSAGRYVFGANDVVPVELSDAIRGNNKVVDRNGASFKGVTGAPSTKIVAWDYDPKSDVFAASDGKTLTAIKSGTKFEFGLGTLYFIRNVQVLNGEVMMAAVKPFRSGHLLLSYGPDGAFRKLKLKDKSDIRPPFIKATPEVVELLTKVSGGVTE